MNGYVEHMIDAARKQFIGKTITDVAYMDKADAEEMGWDQRGVIFELDDGTQLIPFQDDEGNGPGALATSLENELSMFGVVSLD